MKYWLFASVITVLMFVAGWHTNKALPSGVNQAWSARQVPADAVRFLADRTYVDDQGQRHIDQEIFDAIIRLIAAAEQHVVLDMFLYNDWQGTKPEGHRALADELTDALVSKRQAAPDMPIVVVTDPINTAYGGDHSEHFERLRQAGITVVVTDLKPLRDSNPLYSTVWRLTGRWLGNSFQGGWLPHPFAADGSQVTARTWLHLLNFKANHRKVVIADDTVLVTSANPHDGSSAHSNVAVEIRDAAMAQDAITSEAAVPRLPHVSWPLHSVSAATADQGATGGEAQVQLLTESAIREQLLESLRAAGSGDAISMLMFYLAERSVVTELVAAAERGAEVRLILDPNKDAFGHTKNGVPNRPVAHELVTKSDGRIAVRWCATHGEQCHSKLVLWRISGQHGLLAGSANLTRRNLGNYNLETNVLVRAEEMIPALNDAHQYFAGVWQNRSMDSGISRFFTVDYDRYADSSVWKQALYRWQETTGLSSF